MRIAYFSHSQFPATNTNTQQTFWTALEVARRGVEVTLRVPLAADIGATDAREALARYYGAASESLPGKLHVVRHGTIDTSTVPGQLRFDWNVAKDFDSRSCDLVWTRDPIALYRCLGRGLPAVFETYRPDLATRAIYGPWKRACLPHPKLKGLILHSQLAAAAFRGAGVAAERCLVAHNGFAPGLFEPPRSGPEARRALGLDDDERPVVLYAGHAGRGKGMDSVLALAAAVPQARFLILGVNASEFDELTSRARRAVASNVLLKPWVPLADVPLHLWAADCLVIPPTEQPLRRFKRTVLPMKIFMYLGAGRPILAPRLPDVAEVLTDGETAILVPPDRLDATAAALSALLADSSTRARLSAAALQLSAKYTWSARAGRVVEFLQRITDGT